MTDQQPRTAAHVKHEIQHGAVLVAAKGQLGLWDWDPPVELRGAA